MIPHLPPGSTLTTDGDVWVGNVNGFVATGSLPWVARQLWRSTLRTYTPPRRAS